MIDRRAGFHRHHRNGFASVRYVKPMASRDDSAELFVLAMGYRGGMRVAG